MDLIGTWVTGSVGTVNLKNFTDQLHGKYLSKINQELNFNVNRYEPWMSLQTDRIHNKLIGHFSGPVWIVSDQERLRLLSEILSSNFANLERFKIPESNEIPQDFSSAIGSALDLIYSVHSKWKLRFESLIQIISPLASKDNTPLREMGSGTSVHWFKGCIFVSLPKKFAYRDIELSINLVHELGHQALMIYQNCDPILISDPMTPVYSAVRLTHRPALLSFHALIALAYMVEYLNELVLALDGERRVYAQHRGKELRSALKDGLERFEGIQFTTFGYALMSEFKQLLESKHVHITA